MTGTSGFALGRRPSSAVYHVQNAAGSLRRIKKDREQIIQARSREGDGDLKRVRGVDVYALVEEAVAAHTISSEAAHGVGDLEGRPAEDTWSLHPLRLARRVVGHLVLEEDFRAPIAVPHHLVFLVVLDEQAVSRDVVAVDDSARVGGVVRPAHPVAMVRPPGPDVVQKDVVAVHEKADRGLAGSRTADPEEHVGEQGWVVRVALAGVPGAHLQQHRGVQRAGVEEQPGNLDPGHVGDRHGDDSVIRHERREAQAQHNRVGALDLDRTVQVVDPGGEKQVLALGECAVDLLHAVRRLGDEEIVVDGNGRTGHRSTAPRRAHGIALHRGYEYLVVPTSVDVRVWRFSRHRAGRERGIRTASILTGETLCGRIHDAREHLVPDSVGPAIELAVPDEPLLLRAVDHGAAVKLRIGDETAAGERRAGAIIHQGGRPVDVDATHRRGLRYGPEFAGVAAEGRVGHVDGQVRQRAPEVIERDAVAGAITLVVHVNGPVNDNVVRREAEARHGGVVADLKIKRCVGGSICAGQE